MVKMLIVSQSKLSINFKKFVNKSCYAHRPKGGCEIKVKHYEFIWLQMFISSNIN